MGTRKLVLAALAAAACAISFGASGADRDTARAMKDAAKSGVDARLGTSLATLQSSAQKASTLAAPAPQRSQARQAQSAVDPLRVLERKIPGLRLRDGYVAVSAYGDDPRSLRAALESRGLVDATVHATSVSGRAPITALRDLAATPGLRFLRPALAKTHHGNRNGDHPGKHHPGKHQGHKGRGSSPEPARGLVVSQGDRSLRADLARREFGVNGRGVRIGVLSDSYDCAPGAFVEGAPFTRAADDVANGDLPADVLVLKDLSPVPSEDCSDEGRAMMQIVHDVAPGASQAFYTAFESQEDFAAGIRALADAGSRVIVDDVIYFAEPMFEDGVIAQAVDHVYRSGVAYFSAAGNDARLSYESRFRLSDEEGISGLRHDFAPGKAVDTLQRAVAGAGSATLLSVQWDEPFFSANGKVGSRSDVDVWFYDENGEPFEFCSDDPEQLVCQLPGIDVNLDGDAVETPIMVNFSDEDVVVQIGVELYEGPAPGYLKYVWFDLDVGVFSVEEYDTVSGTLYGHANAAGAEAVGAAAWYQTAQWGSPLRPQCRPACLDSFSSAGGTPILFGKDGRRLKVPEYRIKPGVTGPDGGNTTFFLFDLDFDVPGSREPDGFPNFFGTSASAPHVAAVAALVLDQRTRDISARKRFLGPRQLTPDALFWALRLTSQDMKLRNFGGDIGPQRVDNAPGFDFDTGFGFVDAVRVLRATRGF